MCFALLAFYPYRMHACTSNASFRLHVPVPCRMHVECQFQIAGTGTMSHTRMCSYKLVKVTATMPNQHTEAAQHLLHVRSSSTLKYISPSHPLGRVLLPRRTIRIAPNTSPSSHYLSGRVTLPRHTTRRAPNTSRWGTPLLPEKHGIRLHRQHLPDPPLHRHQQLYRLFRLHQHHLPHSHMHRNQHLRRLFRLSYHGRHSARLLLRHQWVCK